MGVKGGVGKSTVAAHLAKALAELGRKVLFLDRDYNGWGSWSLGVESKGLLWWAMHGGERDFMKETRPNLKVLKLYPPSPQFYELILRVHRSLELMTKGAEAYKEVLRSDDFDYFVVDNPVNVGPDDEAARHEREFFYQARPEQEGVGLFVSDPSTPGLRAVANYVKASSTWVKPLALVVNMIPPTPDEVERVQMWLRENCLPLSFKICEAVEFDDTLYQYRQFPNPEVKWEAIFNLAKKITDLGN